MPLKWIFGMGTGRCGTWTLTRLLDAQPGVSARHEGVPLPWIVDSCQLWYELIQFFASASTPIVAPVSYCWINYIGKIMGNIVNPRCICLKRPKEEVVESFAKHSPNLNHWTDPESLHWDPNRDTHAITSNRWPKYDLPKRQAIAAYWEEYYSHAQYLQGNYPNNFRIFDMNDSLNTEFGQRQMLDFAGIPDGQQKIYLHQKLNAHGAPKGFLKEPIASHV